MQMTTNTQHQAAIQCLTVLYDPNCSLCLRCRAWLMAQPKFVDMAYVPQGEEARRLFPQLPIGVDQDGRAQELIVVANNGFVYRDAQAWLMCLWALTGYRGLANKLAQRNMIPLARRVYAMVSSNRYWISRLLMRREEEAMIAMARTPRAAAYERRTMVCRLPRPDQRAVPAVEPEYVDVANHTPQGNATHQALLQRKQAMQANMPQKGQHDG